MAWVACVEGRLASAERYARDVLTAAEADGDRFHQIGANRLLGQVALQRGDPQLAAAHLREALEWVVRSGTLHQGCYCLYEVAAAMQASGEPERAARLLGAESALRERLRLVNSPDERALREATHGLARAAAGEAAFADAWEAGRSLTPAAAFAEALAWRSPEATGCLLPAGLTPREFEVLSLIAEGQTNQEIADVLVRSRRTVDAHVGALLAKLGVASRRAAVQLAREQGWLPASSRYYPP